MGLVLGVGAEWLIVWEADALSGGSRIYEPERDSESLVSTARRKLGLTGPAISVSAACASGNYALAQAKRWLEMGWVDVCLAGACDMAVTPMSLAGFGNLRALSRRNSEPQAASRPFDRGRDGFVMGEGGAMFVLESADSAAPSARLRSGGRPHASSDAHNMVIPSPDRLRHRSRSASPPMPSEPGRRRLRQRHATRRPAATRPGSGAEIGLGPHALRCPLARPKHDGPFVDAAAGGSARLPRRHAGRALPPRSTVDQIRMRHVPVPASSPHPVGSPSPTPSWFGGSNTCLFCAPCEHAQSHARARFHRFLACVLAQKRSTMRNSDPQPKRRRRQDDHGVNLAAALLKQASASACSPRSAGTRYTHLGIRTGRFGPVRVRRADRLETAGGSAPGRLAIISGSSAPTSTSRRPRSSWRACWP